MVNFADWLVGFKGGFLSPSLRFTSSRKAPSKTKRAESSRAPTPTTGPFSFLSLSRFIVFPRVFLFASLCGVFARQRERNASPLLGSLGDGASRMGEWVSLYTRAGVMRRVSHFLPSTAIKTSTFCWGRGVFIARWGLYRSRHSWG